MPKNEAKTSKTVSAYQAEKNVMPNTPEPVKSGKKMK